MAEYNPSKIIKDGNTYNFRDTTKIPLAGSNQISGSLIPATTDSVNLGSPSYQWNQAYIKSLTINGVACGDILTHNVSEFVDVSTAQTIGGVKTFSAGLFASKSAAGELAILEDNSINSTNEDANGMPLTGHTNSVKIKGSQFNVIPCMLTGQLFTSGDTSAELRVYKYKDTNRAAMFNIRYSYASDVAQANFINCNIITNADGVYSIGTLKNKWKTFNGINPGALSLPSISNTGVNAWIALDTTDWVKNASVSNAQKYIPLADGWLNVRVDNATMLAIAVGGNYMHQLIRSETPNSLALLMPVFKNTEVAIMVSGNENLSYNRATFYPCQGNV